MGIYPARMTCYNIFIYFSDTKIIKDHSPNKVVWGVGVGATTPSGANQLFLVLGIILMFYARRVVLYYIQPTDGWHLWFIKV